MVKNSSVHKNRQEKAIACSEYKGYLINYISSVNMERLVYSVNQRLLKAPRRSIVSAVQIETKEQKR